MPLKLKILLVVTPLLVALDQITKIWVVRNVAYQDEEIHLIPGFLSIVHAQNPGAALGIFTDFEHRMPLFLAFTALAVVVLVSMYRQIAPGDRVQGTMVALILAGALGNFIDRVDKQTVTDFVRIYTEYPPLKKWLVANFGTYEYPTFNVADVAIVAGVGLYLWHYFFVERPAARSASKPAAGRQAG